MTARSHTRARRKFWRRNRPRLRALEERARANEPEDPREDWLPPPDGFAVWLADQARTTDQGDTDHG